ncbi:MAG: prepilin-type N-terminal cleavage/methylation domain-containing protein [Bdellovibrionota bacterium]
MMPTFLLRTSRGFTLLEVLLVLGLVAGLALYAVPKLSSGDQVRSAVRRLTVITKQAQTAARLTGMVHRMVFTMPEDPNEPHTYWVERATQKDLTLTLSNENDEDKKEEEATSETGFEMDEKTTKKAEELPGKFYFEDIEYSEKNKVTTGKAYVYFFPQGLVTKAAIHLTNKKAIKWTIILNPLTGVGTVLTEYKSLKDIQ